MNDRTLGAYQRHEKHDTADFPWLCEDGNFSDDGMVEEGWSPVRECPNPGEHVRYDAALADAERAERGRGELRTYAETLRTAVRDRGSLIKDLRVRAEKAEQERDEARAMASLWKEVARHINRDARETIAGIVARQMDENRRIHGARREAIARADEAEQERDSLSEERTHLYAAIKEFQAKESAQPRPLTPDEQPRGFTAEDIDNSMTDRLLDESEEMRKAGVKIRIDRLAAIRLLRAALTVPTRPEGAKELADVMYEFEGHIADLTKFSDWLASRGVRVEGNGR